MYHYEPLSTADHSEKRVRNADHQTEGHIQQHNSDERHEPYRLQHNTRSSRATRTATQHTNVTSHTDCNTTHERHEPYRLQHNTRTSRATPTATRKSMQCEYMTKCSLITKSATYEVDFIDAPVFGQVLELHEHSLQRYDNDGGQNTLQPMTSHAFSTNLIHVCSTND